MIVVVGELSGRLQRGLDSMSKFRHQNVDTWNVDTQNTEDNNEDNTVTVTNEYSNPMWLRLGGRFNYEMVKLMLTQNSRFLMHVLFDYAMFQY